MVFVTPIATLVSLSTLSIFASAGTVQEPLLQLPASAAENRQTVKDMFLYSYDAYKSVLPSRPAIAEILMVTAENTRGVTMM